LALRGVCVHRLGDDLDGHLDAAGRLRLPDLAEVAPADQVDGRVARGKQARHRWGRRRGDRSRLWVRRRGRFRLLEAWRRLLRRAFAGALLDLWEQVGEADLVGIELRLVAQAMADAIFLDDQVERSGSDLGEERLVSFDQGAALGLP